MTDVPVTRRVGPLRRVVGQVSDEAPRHDRAQTRRRLASATSPVRSSPSCGVLGVISVNPCNESRPFLSVVWRPTDNRAPRRTRFERMSELRTWSVERALREDELSVFVPAEEIPEAAIGDRVAVTSSSNQLRRVGQIVQVMDDRSAGRSSPLTSSEHERPVLVIKRRVDGVRQASRSARAGRGRNGSIGTARRGHGRQHVVPGDRHPGSGSGRRRRSRRRVCR